MIILIIFLVTVIAIMLIMICVSCYDTKNSIDKANEHIEIIDKQLDMILCEFRYRKVIHGNKFKNFTTSYEGEENE